MEIVRFKNVSKKFGSNTVLSNIAFVLNTGKVIGLLGPNGSGKTTIMKLISKLIFPTDGEIIFNNDMKIRTLIEEPNFYKTMSGIENLKYLAASEKEVKKADIDKVISLLKMKNFIKRKVGQYSMGMKQRLSLGYAILGDANLLILDEPLNGLDPLAIIEMRDLLRDLAKNRNVCIFISSHILKELQEICTDIILVNKGEIIKNCELNASSPKYEINFLNIENCNRAMNIDKRFIKVLDDSARIEICENEVSELIIRLSKSEIKILGLRRVDNELESIYKEVIGEINVKSRI